MNGTWIKAALVAGVLATGGAIAGIAGAAAAPSGTSGTTATQTQTQQTQTQTAPRAPPGAHRNCPHMNGGSGAPGNSGSAYQGPGPGAPGSV